jgi:suppressor of fused
VQNLGRYVFDSGNWFDAGHTMPLDSPIRAGEDTAIRSVLFAYDPELPPIETPHGRVAFLQLVGLTEDERLATSCCGSTCRGW